MGDKRWTLSTSLRWLLGLLMLWWAVLPAFTTQAHSGGIQRLANHSAGNYWLSAWTQPAELQAGKQVHVTITVAEPPDDPASQEAGGVLSDVMAHIGVTDSAGNTTSTIALLDSTGVFYEAEPVVKHAGIAQFLITIEGEQGVGVAQFSAEIMPADSFPWLRLILIGGIFLLFIIFPRRKSPKPFQRRRE